MNGPAISAVGLTKAFGEVEALRGIDIQVPRGMVFGLLGPNGAGKTTAIRVFTTTLRPSAGRVEVLGRDVVTQAGAVRALIGLAGQYAAVDPNLTGRENLRLIGGLRHLPKRRTVPQAGELLERFDLAGAADRPVRTYSGGMRRRLDVAAALVGDPPVLFLDEPTTGLDVLSRNALWELIRELVGGGTTVLLTTQYLEEADRLAERVAVIDQGRIIADDAPAALKENLGDTVIELSMGDRGQAAEAAQALSRTLKVPASPEGRLLRLSTRDGSGLLLQALRELDGRSLAPRTVTVREPSLDDVFLALTGHRTGPSGNSAAGDTAAADGEPGRAA